MSAIDLMTVGEFAAKHCAEHDDLTVDTVTVHVNLIIIAAVAENRSLWEIGIDADQRVSLIWKSAPEHVWDVLLGRGIQLQAIMSLFGDAS